MDIIKTYISRYFQFNNSNDLKDNKIIVETNYYDDKYNINNNINNSDNINNNDTSSYKKFMSYMNTFDFYSIWNIWGSFIILMLIVTLIGTIFIIILLYAPVSSWLIACKNSYNKHIIIGSLIYLFVITVSALLIFPVSLFEILGVMIVGPYIGFTINLLGNMIAAIIAFFIGRKYLQNWVLKTAKESANFNICIKAMQYHELKAVMAVRLLYIPTGLKNYLLGAISHVSFNIYVICTLAVTSIFSAMNSVVGAMATNIVDLIHKPNLAEWLFIAFGLVSLGGVMVLLYFTYIEILNDLKNEASNVDKSLMHDSDCVDVEESLNPSGSI